MCISAHENSNWRRKEIKIAYACAWMKIEQQFHECITSLCEYERKPHTREWGVKVQLLVRYDQAGPLAAPTVKRRLEVSEVILL